MNDFNDCPTTKAQPMATGTLRRRLSIGLPAATGGRERRFPLTPEAAGVLVEQGYEVRIEAGAARPIRYIDAAYLSRGVAVVDREEALRADIVIALAPLSEADVRNMRRAAMLLTLLNSAVGSMAAVVGELLRRNIVTIALDLIGDSADHAPFADILSEVEGRASITLASAILASPSRGKGILLGGVAGINPCEVLILGAGIAGRAAAASAVGLGALVRLLDSDVYQLRRARELIGDGAQTATLHPHVLEHALRSADVVVGTRMSQPLTIGGELVSQMKRGVIVMDLQAEGGSPLCPSMGQHDVATDIPDGVGAWRVSYMGIGNAVPRTVAMALSDALISLLRSAVGCDGAVNVVRLLPGMQRAVLTFLGKPVDRRMARAAGMRPIDISLLLGCG